MTTDNLQKVAAAAGVSLRWLLFGEEDSSVVSLFERIPAERRDHAIAYLENMAGVKAVAAIDNIRGDIASKPRPQRLPVKNTAKKLSRNVPVR